VASVARRDEDPPRTTTPHTLDGKDSAERSYTLQTHSSLTVSSRRPPHLLLHFHLKQPTAEPRGHVPRVLARTHASINEWMRGRHDGRLDATHTHTDACRSHYAHARTHTRTTRARKHAPQLPRRARPQAPCSRQCQRLTAAPTVPLLPAVVDAAAAARVRRLGLRCHHQESATAAARTATPGPSRSDTP
jgi:hypothetical protein